MHQGLSIKQKEKQLAAQTAVSAPVHHRKIEAEELIAAYQQFVAQLADEDHIKAILKNAKVQAEGYSLQIALHSLAEQRLLDKNKAALVEFLRKNLQHQGISLKIHLAEIKEEKAVSSLDVWKEIVKEYPEVENFIQTFELVAQ